VTDYSLTVEGHAEETNGTLGGRLWRSTGPGADALLGLDMDPGTRGQRLQVGETLRDISVVAEGKEASKAPGVMGKPGESDKRERALSGSLTR
jgi:hypothetical protein